MLARSWLFVLGLHTPRWQKNDVLVCCSAYDMSRGHTTPGLRMHKNVLNLVLVSPADLTS